MNRRAWRRWTAAGFALIFLTATVLLADHGVVVTRDGTAYEGDVREDENEVTVVIRGIETVIPRSNIERIEYGDFEQDFRDRLGKLEGADVPGRIALARDAFDRRRYDLAREVLMDALRIDPNSREATDMLDLVERTMRLERTARPAAGTEPPQRTSPPAAARRLAPGDRRFLSTDDINRIRQKELRRSDTGVRITFQGDVKKRFAQAQNMTFAEFNRLPQVEQAIRILDDGDAEMRQQVRITSDPVALAEFKRFVQPIVLSGCASTACHGGPSGGGLMLFSPADSDPVTYTNFYILTQSSRRTEGRGNQGIFGSSVRRLIERGQGERSLLVNYGLPTNIAEHDHPPVGGKPVQPIFRNKQDPRYQQVVRWMDQTLLPIEPNYDIDYTLPAAAATQPATAPAGE